MFELLLPPYHPQICVLRYSFIKVSPDTIFVHPECNKPSPELSPIRLNCFSSGVDAKSVKHNTPWFFTTAIAKYFETNLANQ